MKSLRPLLLVVLALAGASFGLSGCASMEAPNTESLLSAAGFWTKTPATPKQIAFFESLDHYDLQRHQQKGKVFYTYADEANNVIYFGSPTAYQRYQQLALKQQVAQEQVMTAEMDEDASMDWDGWGPWGTFWD